MNLLNAQIIHIDIDPAEVGKNKTPHLSLIGDVKKILGELTKIAKKQNISTSDQTLLGVKELKKWQTGLSISYSTRRNKSFTTRNFK